MPIGWLIGRPVLAIITLGLWAWMLVDLLGRKNFKDKIVWLLVITFLPIIGPLLYLFMVKLKK